MGQKVSPTGFRLGITEEWRSRWYADKDYAQNLANDLAIRKFLDKQLARAAVSKVEIERAGDKSKVMVTTARPGGVMGKKGAELDSLRKKLEKVANGPGNIEVVGEGPPLMRIRPPATGSASRIRTRTCHTTIIVAPREEAYSLSVRKSPLPGSASVPPTRGAAVGPLTRLALIHR